MKCTKCNGYGYIDNLEGDGLKCPICNGTGEYEPFDTDVELDKLYPTEQTNEEWFCGLDTEDKAREISDMTAQGYWEEELVYKWLKEKHE